MKSFERSIRSVARQGIGLMCAALLVSFPFGTPLAAQEMPPQPQAPVSQPGPQPDAQPAPLLSPDQLDDLVAPIALYPDGLLSQMLVASTYPLEIVQASQWLQQNQGLQGQARMDAARQQNWDPSIQALVAFPDVLSRLSSNINWTTALGNAFLAQQADVMSAVQQMRSRAQANGRLSSNADQTVTTQTQNGQTAIDIAPADPQVIYVPQYNPEYIWGPPAWGYYPPLYYPAVGFGFGFGPGIYLDAFFGGWGGWGFGGWGGWGWGPNWFGGRIYQNVGFFGRYGFHNFYGGSIWAHNAYHRLGVPYSNARVAQRFGGNYVGRGGAFHAGAGAGAQRTAGVAGGQFRGGQSFARGAAAGQRFGNAAGAARGSASGGGQFRGSQSFSGSGGGWQRFGGANGAARGGAVEGNRGFGGGGSYGRGSSQGFANGGGSYRSSPSYRQTPSMGGSGFRSAPSYGGGRSFSGAQRSFGGGGSGSFGGGSSRSFSGGGGSRSFGGGHSGGGSHGGGGGHGGRR